ncbi:cytochrome c oxidase assembly factor 6 [Mangifera indica]|uniref:cytochrome c oxidase assembly factor 6 n=1 Tax=Mangifera indica TaxID=29780 RepID=UPI001CF96F23|nr:cytochrome c oxidase assembly factor 6 [Mangifera indica]
MAALKTYASSNPDEVHTDVLFKARESCYKTRDAFYSCLEKEADKKPTEIASVGLLYPVECKKSRDEFVENCRASWVKHFDRLYCKNKRVQRLLDDGGQTRRGQMLLPQPYTFKPPSESS